MLVYFRDTLRQMGKTAFSRRELGQILSLYGARVQRGDWRDYAIDSGPDRAVFSIFRSSRETPAYSIVKTLPRGSTKRSPYAAYSGNTLMTQSADLADVLRFLEEQP